MSNTEFEMNNTEVEYTITDSERELTKEELNSCKRIIPDEQFSDFSKNEKIKIAQKYKELLSDNKITNERGEYEIGLHYKTDNLNVFVNHIYENGFAEAFVVDNKNLKQADWEDFSFNQLKELPNLKLQNSFDKKETIENKLSQLYPTKNKPLLNKIEDNIIPLSVQTQAIKNLGHSLSKDDYFKYSVNMYNNIFKIDESKWSKNIEPYKNELKNLKNWLNNKNLSKELFENYTHTEQYKKDKEKLGALYNLNYTNKNHRKEEFQLSQKKEKKHSENNQSSKKSVQLDTIKKEDVPRRVNEILKNNGKELDLKTYTNVIFNTTKKLYEIPKDENYLYKKNPEQYKLLEPLFKQYSKYDIEDKNALKNEFNIFISDGKNKDALEILGNLYADKKEGKIDSYQIKIDDYTKNTMEENLKAIENGKFFLQQNNIVPNYIFNPENNEVYKGEAQMHLQNENLKNNENNTMYSPFHQAISNGLNIPPGMKPKATIIKYPEQNGIQVYDIVVPSRNFIKKQEKMLKEERKLIAQNKINESKFYQKYGYVPAYPQTLQEEKQPPLINKEQLKIDKPQISLENKIEGVIEHDMKMYWACSFAKVPFKPTVNYNESPYKEQLAAFVKSNPEKMEKIANETYENITTQIKTQKNSNQNTNTNENNQEKQNTNTASKGRTK